MRYLVFVFTFILCITVRAQAPVAEFSATPLSVCLGEAITFTNLSTPGGSPITTYTWNFGNGQTSNAVNPTYTYNLPGTYTITLAVQAANGSADAEVKTNYVVVNPLPSASFNLVGTGCAVPFDVSFTNTSSTGPGIVYAWNFGNSQTSTLQSPDTVTYTTPGNFTISLVVTNQNSGCNASANQSITVSNYTAGMIVPSIGCLGQPITFQNNSTVGTNTWNWDSGGAGSSTNTNPIFTYQTVGNYTINLTTQNTLSGCTSSISQAITILPSPTPSFTASPTSGCSPLPVTFTNTSGTGAGFIWTFGDSTTFNGQNPPVHIYQGNGSYDVSLLMTAANGCSTTITMNDLIVLTDPTVQFTASSVLGCSPMSVQFSQNSISPDPINNPITGWLWNFGDNTTYNGQTPPPHLYAAGIFDVSLTVTTLTGCSTTLTVPDYIVAGQINQINFTTTPASQCAKTNIQFTNNTIITMPHTLDEEHYTWHFGDGQTSTDFHPTHQYLADTGFFDVKLIVEFRGCIDSITIPHAVYIKGPIAGFNTSSNLFCNPTTLPVNLAVTDVAKSGKFSDNIDMTWRWGDGFTNFMDDPVLDDANLGSNNHNYTNYGTYVVTQIIVNHTTGCTDSTSQTIHISSINALFTIPNDSVCKNAPLYLTGTGTTSFHPMSSWVYDMGNTQFAQGSVSQYNYPQAGTYAITLLATNVVGCTDTYTINPIEVLEIPIAHLFSSDSVGCAPFPVTFSNTSTTQGTGFPLASYEWEFPDDTTTQFTQTLAETVDHIFQIEGNFNVTLTAIDEFGCHSVPAPLLISVTKPAVNFLIDSIICDLETFVTTNTTTGVAPLSYEWILDGNSLGFTQNTNGFFDEVPSNTSTHVDHSLTLIATDGNSCINSKTVTLTVSMPVAGISYSMTGGSVNSQGAYVCPPVFVDFTDGTESMGDILFWEWNFGDNSNLATVQDPSNIYVYPGVYSTTLHIIDEFGCNSDTTLVNYLTIYGPTGDPSIAQSAFACGQFVTLDVDDLNNSVASVVWNTGDGNTTPDSTHFIYNYTTFGTYAPTLVLTDSNNCVVTYALDTINIIDNGLNAYFTSNLDEAKLAGSIEYYDGSTFISSPIVNWHWDYGDGSSQTNSTGTTVSHASFESGYQTVVLTVTDEDGCKSIYSKQIFINADYDAPNVFTPNGDQLNDTFSLFTDLYETFDIVVQNRWGNVVCSKKNQTGILMWDGTDNGQELCNDGVYFFQIVGVLNDGITQLSKTGFVTLLDGKK